MFSPLRGGTAEGCEVRAHLPPFSGAKKEGRERQGGPCPRLGLSVYESGSLLALYLCRCPEFFQGRWGFSHPLEGKMEAYRSPGVPTS